MMATTHFLKCDAPMFDAIARGDKNFEIRKDDRAYQAGDHLNLERLPFPGDALYSHVHIQSCEVTFVLRGGQYGLEDGYVALSIRLSQPETAQEKGYR
jgi:hypothetical protein